ncbi:ferredoxin [Gordonia sp. HNM0687]|uniref:Ferredoxin n=1 Tax=Gordonia mangrovi TaxID=2665643 RepID=A0A6L7GX39_9ACTN|nr:ferredoxin [Gordonia mangrovi]MXP24183.1 ferredoxin [Gordonia mangrovi]UVF76925.1 ferredoxin [Gordonia mangrovi]
MIVRVDSNYCTGHGRCVAFAPDLFELGDEGFLDIEDQVVPDNLLGAVREAVQNCPERAISLIDD